MNTTIARVAFCRFVGVVAMLGAVAGAVSVDLLETPTAWGPAKDGGGSVLTRVSTSEAPLGLEVKADGATEDFPRLGRAWEAPQDWSRYSRVRLRVRVVCEDKAVRSKPMAIVFYDDKTRRQDLADHPMTQQSVAHTVPVNRWMEYRDWLPGIQRSAIQRVDLYLYEVPPAAAHAYRWEFAELAVEGVDETMVVFDTEAYAKGQLVANLPGQAAGSVRTTDGLGLTLGSSGAIVRLAADALTVGEPGSAPCGLLVRDVGAGGLPVAVGGSVLGEGDVLRQKARVDSLGLRVEATYRAIGERIEIAGVVADERGADRAVTVYVALPLAEAPWQWWDSVAVRRLPDKSQPELAYLETGMGYGLNGAHSKYPLGALTWPERAGLCLGVRMDEPVVHRIAWSPDLRLFYVALDFGLVPGKTHTGRPLSEAPFRILLYRHDPAWGFRSALQRYYGFFPEFFTKRVPHEGGWYVWGDLRKTEGALGAGFGFHWGPEGNEAITWDNANRVLALLYIEPELFQLTMGDFTRAPTAEEALARVERLAAGDAEELARTEKLGYARSYAPANWLAAHSLREELQTVAKAAQVSVCADDSLAPSVSSGQYPWMSESRWGTIFPCNLDPDLVGGKGWFCRSVYIDSGLAGALAAGARYDGIALDSLGGYGHLSRANYRREHFAFADTPLSFGAQDHVPVQVTAFSTIEWLRDLARDQHGNGKVLMANCSWNITPGWLTFAAPYLDIFGAEAVSFADPDFARAIAFRKPCTDLPYTPQPEADVALHLLLGIHPGHGNDIAALTRYAPVLQRLVAAGWEPIPQARVTPETVRLERFGTGASTFLVLQQPGEVAVQARVSVATEALGLSSLSVREVLSGRMIAAQDKGFQVDLGPHGTLVLAVGSP